MAYFRKLSSRLTELQTLLNRDDNWMVLISADPDAIAGAFAFQRLISKRVHSVTIGRINEVTRPDNLAMLRYLGVPVVKWEPSLAPGFQRFAIVDSQPHHSPAFDDVNFSVIIDHQAGYRGHEHAYDRVFVQREIAARQTAGHGASIWYPHRYQHLRA